MQATFLLTNVTDREKVMEKIEEFREKHTEHEAVQKFHEKYGDEKEKQPEQQPSTSAKKVGLVRLKNFSPLGK